MRNDFVNGEADKDGRAGEDPSQVLQPHKQTSLRAPFCGLPVSLHPGLPEHTSARTTQGLGTGFGGHSSKGLPFSNTLQDRKHRPICEVVLFETKVLKGWLSHMTENFSYQDLNTQHHCFRGMSGSGGRKTFRAKHHHF